MPIFKGSIRKELACFVRKHKLVLRTAVVVGVLVGVYFLGTSQGWWSRFLF